MIEVGQKYLLNEDWPSHPRGDVVIIKSVRQAPCHFPGAGNIGDGEIIGDHHVEKGLVTLVEDALWY